MKKNGPVIFVSGHRNPDIDSIAAAAALAELRRRQGMPAVAVCPGVMPERARCLFEKFRFPVPETRHDLYVRVGDMMDRDVPKLKGWTSLYAAVRMLRKSGCPRLPVVGENDEFLGMLSPLALLSDLLNVGAEGGLAGRRPEGPQPGYQGQHLEGVMPGFRELRQGEEGRCARRHQRPQPVPRERRGPP